MTDNIATNITALFKAYDKPILAKSSILLHKDGRMELCEKEFISSYTLKKNNAIEIEIPELDSDDTVAIVQIALAVGKRLERFERGQKANAGRDATSRKKIAQNAIQSRWKA